MEESRGNIVFDIQMLYGLNSISLFLHYSNENKNENIEWFCEILPIYIYKNL